MIGEGQPLTLTKVESYGEFEPVADNASAEGRARNRRVELYYSLEGIKEAMASWAEGGEPVVMADPEATEGEGAADR